MMLVIAAGLPIMAAGLHVGGRFHTGMTQQTFQRAISVLLIFSGILLLIR